MTVLSRQHSWTKCIGCTYGERAKITACINCDNGLEMNRLRVVSAPPMPFCCFVPTHMQLTMAALFLTCFFPDGQRACLQTAMLGFIRHIMSRFKWSRAQCEHENSVIRRADWHARGGWGGLRGNLQQVPTPFFCVGSSTISTNNVLGFLRLQSE